MRFNIKLKIVIIFLLITNSCWAANEVQLAYAHSNNLYFRIFNSTGQVWNTSGTPAFETWAGGNVTDYDIALTGTGGSFYLGTFPTMVDGTYSVVAYLRAGGAPAVNDGVISGATMIWLDGAELTVSSLRLELAMPTTKAGSQP